MAESSIQLGINMFSPHNSRPLRRKVYIGDLGNNGSVQEIGNAFSIFGPLTNVWVARNPPGFAFVDFEDPRHAEEAIRALNGTILCGRRVRVAFARNSRTSYRSPPPLQPPRNSVDLPVCYKCDQLGHYYRDCILTQIDWLQLADGLDTCSESDDDESYSDPDWNPEIEWTTNQSRNYYPRYHHDSGSSNGYQSRGYRSQEEHQNTAWGPSRNNRPQDEPRNLTWRSRRSNRPQENHRNVASGPSGNNRSQGEHRNARSQGQRSNGITRSPEAASAISTSSTSNQRNDASSDIKCAICLDTVEDRMEYILCGHGFHAKCCNEWLAVNGACPICRTRVRSQTRHPVQDYNDEDDWFETLNFSQESERVPAVFIGALLYS